MSASTNTDNGRRERRADAYPTVSGASGSPTSLAARLHAAGDDQTLHDLLAAQWQDGQTSTNAWFAVQERLDRL